MAKPKRDGGRAKPILLIIAGVYLLVGCIPVPSSQQYMTNGKLKPSYLIGKGEDSPIRLGYTKIDDAIARVIQQVTGAAMTSNFGGFSSDWLSRHFVDVDGGRRYVLPYSRRSGYMVWPLCFRTEGLSETDYLILDVNADGIVTDYQSGHDLPSMGITLQELQESALDQIRKFATTRPWGATQP